MSDRNGLRAAILFALVFPTLVTWAYFIALRDQPAWMQQLTYSAGKLLQFSFPIVCLVAWRKSARAARSPGADAASAGEGLPASADVPSPARKTPHDRRGLVMGIAFGLLIAAAMLGLYFIALKPMGFFDGPDQQIRRKIAGMGLTQTWKYVSVGVFYALGHSFLEEYYWRWFVFRQLQRLTSTPWAIGVSSLGFMAHHILVLATFFGWTSPATWLFSGSIAVGGAVWAGLYQQTRTLLAPWAGHCLVDAAIFALGFDLARDLMV